MRAVVQRTLTSSVTSEGVETGRAGLGLTVLLGVAQDDNEKDALYMAEKIANLRIFEDDKGKMNRSLVDIGGDMLVVSQFTLCGDARHGRRPSFTEAAPPELAEALYEKFVSAVSAMGIRTATGRFRTEMVVSLENHGPVTILVDSKKLF
ncbi:MULTISPECIES: D-aminoacyl-tRNA deacylase [Megasphaera]|uniref:D-aminoacyl-tRNA deacylase n=1 Tax=Megasphaera stantonii TaxID=2144175 RepID=A0A346AXF9_9FIRM|nr:MULTISPECIES: D-aminoacyl-tRNA deacylase [Megasphaera]AXL20552.1 D-tyrosyl-tRNA(Tyr) deacylase [Megasphaera stantonii]MCU6713416.1 D-aminoacyl-tRNA deacylase [Megasphaera butyrica]SCG98777.1 D-tyrosyl-tRNA(Tyr) deacylase [uncultured Megasphaera sp.]SCI11644.1 D-tyrosyl-tRNA(Tyr) deacylase [uncultured Ruminococcus sp.]